MSNCNLSASDIAAVGVTNQRETTIVWNKSTGKPYHNAIVWNDTRTVDICKRLSVPDKSRFKVATGLPLDCYFSLSKLVYLLETVPDLRAAAESGEALFGTVDSYLLWKLSSGAVHSTDVTNASRTMMMNLNTLAWDDEILQSCGIPKIMLPDIRPSIGEFCRCSSIESICGVPVSAVLGDQQAALFGQGCFSPGEVKCTYGTGAFLLMNTGESIVYNSNGLLTTVAFQVSGEKPLFALEGAVKYCGSVMQWLRDNLELIAHASESESLAGQVPDNGGVYFVPAFAGLGAPDWDDTARGTIIGLTAFNSKAHIVRAALEAAAYQVNRV
jgi:glycerol kinase